LESHDLTCLEVSSLVAWAYIYNNMAERDTCPPIGFIPLIARLSSDHSYTFGSRKHEGLMSMRASW